MYDFDEFPLARRMLGSALITGASGAGVGLSLARPFMHESLEIAYKAAAEARRASVEGAKGGMRSAVEAGGPALKSALEAKDRLRRRAIATLPPGLGDAVEEWRQQFIGAEKVAYYGSQRLARDMEPAFEVARARSKGVLEEAIRAFEDVADVALATSIKFGESLQESDLPRPPSPKGRAEKPKAAKRKSKKRSA